MISAIRRPGTVLVAATALTLPAAPALAAPPVQNDGPCSASSHWTLQLDAHRENFVIVYRVDTEVVGQLWRFQVNSDNGALIAAGALPADSSGSFSVTLVALDLPGPDRVLAKALNTVTRETCNGRAILPDRTR